MRKRTPSREAVVEKRRKQFARLPKGLSVGEVADRLRLTYHAARYWIKRLDYAADIRAWGAEVTGPVPPAWAPKIRRLPKNLTVEQAARRLNLSRTYTQQLLRRAKYKSRPGYANQKVSREQWAKVNWKLQNGEIARLMGVSRERVRQIREREGIPKVS